MADISKRLSGAPGAVSDPRSTADLRHGPDGLGPPLRPQPEMAPETWNFGWDADPPAGNRTPCGGEPASPATPFRRTPK